MLEVNVADRYITVEAGCTWAQVHEALQPTGMNTGYWGPLSGINATVGGALSQNSAFFGSTLHGTVAEHVLGVTVLLAERRGRDDRLRRPGRHQAVHALRRARHDRPVPRRHRRLRSQAGGDAAARAAPQHLDYLGFGFEDMRSMALAQVEMSAVRAISEGFGIDRTKAAQFGQRQPAVSDGVKILGSIVGSSKGLLQGIKDAVGVATDRRRLSRPTMPSRSISWSKAAVPPILAANMAALRAIGAQARHRDRERGRRG